MGDVYSRLSSPTQLQFWIWDCLEFTDGSLCVGDVVFLVNYLTCLRVRVPCRSQRSGNNSVMPILRVFSKIDNLLYGSGVNEMR